MMPFVEDDVSFSRFQRCIVEYNLICSVCNAVHVGKAVFGVEASRTRILCGVHPPLYAPHLAVGGKRAIEGDLFVARETEGVFRVSIGDVELLFLGQ